jgi:enoyl-CoA hydratase
MNLSTMTYQVTGRIARITLNRPARSNALTFETPRELGECVEAANLDPGVSVIALAGNGAGFCGGYDLVMGAEQQMRFAPERNGWPEGSPMDPEVISKNHVPGEAWDPTVEGRISRCARISW